MYLEDKPPRRSNIVEDTWWLSPFLDIDADAAWRILRAMLLPPDPAWQFP
jgi:hypothetical protein